MTKHLFNYCPIDWYEDKMQQSGFTLDDYIGRLGLDGIEQFVYETKALSKPYIKQTVGVHLRYWPYWMDFWLKKVSGLSSIFPIIK